MYKDLSLKEKAKVLLYGGKLGLTSVEDIAKLYDDAISHKFAEGSMSTPDWDPNNPYHYHTASGEKVVITPEDWEKHKGLPYFKQVEDAVLTELAAHPGPEYEINPQFSLALRQVYKGNMGPKYQNYSSFSGNLPEGYSFTPEGLISDNQGNLYVLRGFRQTPKFTYDESKPLMLQVLEGNNKGNVTFYPVNMEKTVKPALPISSTMNVNKERYKAISEYIKDNTTHSTVNGTMYKEPYFYPDIDAVDYDWEEWKKEHPVQELRRAVTKDYLYDLMKLKALNHFIFADEEGLEYDPFWSEDEDWVNDSYMQELFDEKFNSYINKPINLIKLKSNITKKPTYAKAKQKAVIKVGPLLIDNVLTYAQGGPIVSPYGQWKYPGRDTIIPSNNITMNNVNYPILGISDTGDTKVMMPWNDYKFKGSVVYEHPLIGNLALEGKKFNRQRISDDDYFSIMEKVALENNAKWNKDRKKRNQRLLSIDEELVRLLNSNDYDYRGYYTKYPNSKANADTHWTDEFKTVYHPTFSEESRYSGVIDRNYNPYGYIGGSWGNNDEFIPAPWLAGNQYLLGGYSFDTEEPTGRPNIIDKWREYNIKKQNYYNQLPIINEQAGVGRIDLPEVTIEGENLQQKDYNNLRLTLKSNPFVLASAVQDPFMSTVLANKNQNDLMEAALNLENIYDKMLQATMVSSLGKSLLFGSIPEKVSTVGSLFGAYGADKAQSKIIQKASDNKYSSWENILLDFGVPNSIGMFINPAYWVGGKYGGKYANHIGRNATEAVLRLGDVALNPQRGALVLAKDPNFYKFVFGNNPDLAYKVGMQYSGEEAVIDYPDINQSDIAKAHPGDQIDVYLGKSKSRFPEVGRDRVSKEMNKYIDENYSGRDIKVYDMGDIESPYKTDRNGLIEYSVDMSSKYQNTPSVQRYNSVTGEYDRLLDPGNFHVQSRELIPDQMYKQSNEDLFKWNPKDYWGPRKSLTPKGLLNKALTNTGLRAINEYGTPFVSLWNDIVYNKDFMTNGGLYTTPNYSNEGNLFKKGGIYIKPENRGKFTALKKRTGHSASWFKAHGTPALKKMATFELNARHWKHDEGGHLFLENGYLQEAPKTFAAKQYDINLPLDWNAESWLGERADNYKGPKYTDEDIKIFESHVPEYRLIEENARNNGTWLKMSDGTTWHGDPRDWVLMQSKAFKNNYEDKVWYTGLAEWPTTVNYNGQYIQTDKVKRARYHNGLMWFSDNPGYALYFADYVDLKGLNSREWQHSPNGGYEKAPYINGMVFTAAIPKNSEIHSLLAPKEGTHDLWQKMPYVLTETGIERIPEYKLHQNKKGRNLINDDILDNKLITDDLVNHAENLGWKGLYMFNVDDGPVFINKPDENYIPQESLHLKGVDTSRGTINEFISLPGLTEKLKFIHGNNGDFNPNIEDKYSYLTKDNYGNLIKFGGKIKK